MFLSPSNLASCLSKTNAQRSTEKRVRCSSVYINKITCAEKKNTRATVLFKTIAGSGMFVFFTEEERDGLYYLLPTPSFACLLWQNR